MMPNSPGGQLFSKATRELLEQERPDNRPLETWPSRVTSLDIKLAYNRESDAFVAFILSDCNANPEGIPTVHDKNSKKDITKQAAKSYAADIKEGPVVVWLPGEVWNEEQGEWQNETSWLTRDRQLLVEAIRKETDNDITLCSPTPSGKNKKIRNKYYINLNDSGDKLSYALDRSVRLFSNGANAPSAVWTLSLPQTSKVGIADALDELVGAGRVCFPEYRRVTNIKEINSFRNEVSTDIVIKDPFGTWGTGVVGVSVRENAYSKLKEKEKRVKNKRNKPLFSLVNEDGGLRFNSRGSLVKYGIVESAISGEITQRGGQYEVISVPSVDHPLSTPSPVDFVQLVLAQPDGTLATPSCMVRVSGKTQINGNPSFKYINDIPIKKAMSKTINIPHPNKKSVSFEFNLRKTLEQIAERSVSESEINDIFTDTAEIGLAARNLSAFQAENQI